MRLRCSKSILTGHALSRGGGGGRPDSRHHGENVKTRGSVIFWLGNWGKGGGDLFLLKKGTSNAQPQ